MDRRAKNATVDIHHEARVSKELRENLVEIGGLPDVPQRLGMMHRDNAIKLRGAAVPCLAVSEVGANERRNLTNCAGRDACRNYISDHHVALGMELPPVFVLDPAQLNSRPELFLRGR